MYACLCMYDVLVFIYDHHITCSKRMDQQGKAANPARGQLNNRENY